MLGLIHAYIVGRFDARLYPGSAPSLNLWHLLEGACWDAQLVATVSAKYYWHYDGGQGRDGNSISPSLRFFDRRLLMATGKTAIPEHIVFTQWPKTSGICILSTLVRPHLLLHRKSSGHSSYQGLSDALPHPHRLRSPIRARFDQHPSPTEHESRPVGPGEQSS